jgi:phasin family protein
LAAWKFVEKHQIFVASHKKSLTSIFLPLKWYSVAAHNKSSLPSETINKENQMFPMSEQLSAATKSQIESQIAMFNTLAAKAFESMEKVIELNVNATKASIEESNATVKQLLSAKDPQEFFALSAAQAQPNTEKALAYSRHLASIASSTQAEFTKAAETQIAENNRKVSALVDELAKSAPAGSENAVAAFKAVIGNANAGYEQFSKSTKQAVETIEANMNNATTQFTQAATQAVEKTAAAARAKK